MEIVMENIYNTYTIKFKRDKVKENLQSSKDYLMFCFGKKKGYDGFEKLEQKMWIRSWEYEEEFCCDGEENGVYKD